MNTDPGRFGRVVAVGSVNIDLVMRLPRLPVAGQTVLGGVLARHEGGKGANQAVAAARAGGLVHFVGAVGDADGEPSVAALAADGVDVTAVARLPARTGHAFVLVDEASGENQVAVAPGANGLVTARRVTAVLRALTLTAADVVVLSFELPAGALRAAAAVARSCGSALVVNPAPVMPRSRDLLHAAIITPNAGELAVIAAEPGPPGSGPAGRTELATAAAGLARSTGGQVIVTLGADGVLLASASGTEHFPGYRVTVADSTGAGDTFTGVLAASLAAGRPLRDSVARAVAASALAVTRDGARAGMPDAAAIDALLAGQPPR